MASALSNVSWQQAVRGIAAASYARCFLLAQAAGLKACDLAWQCSKHGEVQEALGLRHMYCDMASSHGVGLYSRGAGILASGSSRARSQNASLHCKILTCSRHQPVLGWHTSTVRQLPKCYLVSEHGHA